MLEEDNREDVMTDIDSLQLSSNKDVFEKAKELFIKKWVTKKQTEFINYMKSMWLSTHQNWYEGIAHNTPSQNNGLESWNHVIKKEETFRERMPLSAFLQQCIDSVEKWSKQYLNNDKEFVLKPSIDLKGWTEGYNWARSEKDII
jgi:hypothetical protein